MLKFSAIAFLALPLGLWPLDAPSPQEATKLIGQALLARKFINAQIRDVMLTEPEKHRASFRYHSEFTVVKKGRPTRCEDWYFTLEHVEEVWIVSDIKRGRCND